MIFRSAIAALTPEPVAAGMGTWSKTALDVDVSRSVLKPGNYSLD